MRIKRFRGRDVKTVMERVRRELGGDAVILRTRPVIEGGVFGFFGRPAVEVVAALPPEKGKAGMEAAEGKRIDFSVSREVPEAFPSLERKNGSRRRPGAPGVGRGEDFVEREEPAVEKGSAGKDGIFLPLRISPGIDGKAGVPARAVFLGPPGAGKTSSLGRLAWHLGAGRRTLVLSLEEEGRLSGVARWKEFWKAIGVEYRPFLDLEELESSLREEYDAWLVDTPPLDGAESPGWLKGLLRSLEGFTRFVVVDAYMDPGELETMTVRYREIAPFELVIAKVDHIQGKEKLEVLAEAAGKSRIFYTRDPSITSPLFPLSWEAEKRAFAGRSGGDPSAGVRR